MTIHRHTLQIAAASSSVSAGDTGPYFNGAILQMQWAPTTADTGADLTLTLLAADGDTTGSVDFYNDNDCLGAGFLKSPRLSAHAGDGLDTGADSSVPVVSAGQRVRAKAAPGGNATLAGTLYIWVGDA